MRNNRRSSIVSSSKKIPFTNQAAPTGAVTTADSGSLLCRHPEFAVLCRHDLLYFSQKMVLRHQCVYVRQHNFPPRVLAPFLHVSHLMDYFTMFEGKREGFLTDCCEGEPSGFPFTLNNPPALRGGGGLCPRQRP